MDFLIGIIFVAVVAGIIIKRKKPELWAKLVSKLPIWRKTVGIAVLKNKVRETSAIIWTNVRILWSLKRTFYRLRTMAAKKDEV